MTKWITAERARAALRHAVICPNVTGRAKERVAQSKRARAGLLATVDKPQWREPVSFGGAWPTPYCLYLALSVSCLVFVFVLFFLCRSLLVCCR